MANWIFLLCLLLAYLTVNVIECGRFGGGRSGGRSGGGWGGSSSSRSSWSSHSYKPSSLSSHSYPSSSSGLSGYGYKPSSSSVSHKYPSSSSGLSGTGSSWSSNSYKPSSGIHNYPASTGLSGSGSSWSSNNYKPSSGSYKYPSSTGLSGSGSSWSSNNYKPSSGSHNYPSSSTGLSGSGSSWSSNNYKPSSGSHNYPSSSTGLSGSGSSWSSNNYRPSSSSGVQNYPSSSVYKLTHHGTNSYGTNNHYYHVPYSYHSSPQYVYVHEYRNSGSRYGDLLTGLALYNLGRSHSYHYHDHYYYDDYYRHRYSGSSNSNQNVPRESASCNLRIKENGREEVLKIPCEIVSTFTESGENITESITNTTVCVTNTTATNLTLPAQDGNNAKNPNATQNNVSAWSADKMEKAQTMEEFMTSFPTANDIQALLNETVANVTAIIAKTKVSNITTDTSSNSSLPMNNTSTGSLSIVPLSTTVKPDISASTVAPLTNTSTLAPNITTSTVVPATNTRNNNGSSTISGGATNSTVVSSTNCTTTVAKDPLKVKGPPIDPSAMKCSVEIRTDSFYRRHNVDCSKLITYAKMPEPKPQSRVVPTRDKLKALVEKPPWWLSMFIAV